MVVVLKKSLKHVLVECLLLLEPIEETYAVDLQVSYPWGELHLWAEVCRVRRPRLPLLHLRLPQQIEIQPFLAGNFLPPLGISSA